MKILAWVRDTVLRSSGGCARGVSPRRRAHAAPFAAEIEALEVRWLLSSTTVAPVAVTDLVRAGSTAAGATPLNTSGPTGYTPAQIRHAYGFDQVSFNGAAADGTGTTIAIVDAYDDPNIANDLHQFDVAFGLPDPPSFTKVNQNGSTTGLPRANSGWITEIALDVEWAHAIAPGANILLVEASSNSFSNLMTAVNTARNYAGVDVVSMSWGGSEDPTQTAYDGTFTTPNGHTGVTFVASSGDTGAPTSYPSSSPNVLSVGGTTLILTSNGTWTSESGWSGSGGGISSVESQPAYQHGIVTQSSSFRTNPDVAYDADPNTGFGVYDSYNNGTRTPWGQWGGTSDAAPQWAALIAIADQGRVRAGKGTLDGATQTLPMLYAMSAADFHDITSGTSTGSPQYSAGPGYDLVTGRGSPNANLVINDLIGVAGPPTLTAISTLGVAYSPTPFNISYSSLLAASNAADSNGQPIQFRIASIQSGSLSIIHNNVTTTVVADLTNGTLLGPGDTLVWTPPASAGNAVNAFSVVAFDGTSNSAPAVQVKINVQVLGFDLTGPWTVKDSSGNVLGLGSVSQSSAGVTVTAPGASPSNAQYTAANQITASNFDGQSSVVGTIDTSTADQGRILWSDGTVWLRISLGGQYVVNGQLASITQNGTSLTINPPGAAPVTGVINSPTQLTASGFGGSGTYGQGVINFGNGQVWTKLDLSPNDTTSAGSGGVQVVQNGTTTLGFVDRQGESFSGNFTDPTHLITTSAATGFAVGTTATVGGGKITWSTGEVWSENLTVLGTISSTAAVSLTVTPTSVTLTNEKGSTSRAVITAPNTIMAVDWGNLTGTRTASGISWSNGTSWNNFDFNALNAAFANSLPAVVTPTYDLSGVWTTTPGGGLDSITQTGSNLTLVNEKGGNTTGSFTAANTITTGWGVTGTIDTTTADDGRILWSNGTVWMRMSLSGQWSVSVNNGPAALGSIAESGTALTYTGPGGNSTGSISSATQVTGFSSTGTLVNGTTITFPNGQVWTKLDLAPNYTTSASGGGSTHVVQNGTTTLGFVNRLGESFSGHFSDPTHLVTTSAATGFAVGTTATVGGGKITWSTGEVWSESLTVQGNISPSTTVSLTVTPTLVFLTNEKGSVSRANITGPNTIVALDWGNLTGTRTAGGISWSNNTAWNNFDFNALNAAFAANINTTETPQILTGTNPSGARVSVIGSSTQVWLIDPTAQVSHAQITSATTIVAIDGSLSGLTGTMSSGKITWSNGVVWNNFNAAALTALFTNVPQYPFPA